MEALLETCAFITEISKELLLSILLEYRMDIKTFLTKQSFETDVILKKKRVSEKKISRFMLLP